jgi:hypothetical protein
LRFESAVTFEHFENTVPDYPIKEHAQTYPFRYADEDILNLGRALTHHYHPRSVTKWALQFLDASDTTDTMKMLRAMTHGIRDQFGYGRRFEKGVRTPEETLLLGSGSCRDVAVLMTEGVRSLGVAAGHTPGCRPIFPARAGSILTRRTASSETGT